MKKKNKILLWVMVSVLSLTLALGIGLVIIGNTQDKLPNLSQSELMVKLNGQIAEMSSDELTDAIDDFQNTIDQYNYPLALVSFEINDEIKKVEVVKKSNDYVLPDWADTETHYLFGWKIEGDDTVYDVLSNYNVEQSIIFSAVMKNHPVVTLQVKEQAPQEIIVKYDTEFVLPTLEETNKYLFNGWKENGVGEMINGGVKYDVIENMTFVADLTEKDWIRQEYPTGPVNFDSNQVWTDGESYYMGTNIKLNPETLTTERTTWKLPTVEDWQCADDIWTDGVNSYYSVSFYDDADGKQKNYNYVIKDNVWEEVTWNINVAPSCVWSDGVNTYLSNGDDCQYVLIDGIWEEKTWEGFTDFRGDGVWTDGNCFYISTWDKSYVLNGNTWEEKTWNINLTPNYDVLTVGNNIYYSASEYDTETDSFEIKHYVLENDTWKEKIWNGITDFTSNNIWTDGENVFCGSTHKLDKATSTWFEVNWTGDFGKDGNYIWTDNNNNVYYSGYSSSVGIIHYALVNGNWVVKNWQGITDFNGTDIWKTETNTYCLVGDYNYVLNGDTWELTNWDALVNYDAENVWTDGTNIYYSGSDGHYVLNENTWEEKVWNGDTNFTGKDVWTDGFNIYFTTWKVDVCVLKGDTWEAVDWYKLSEYSNIWSDGTNIYSSRTVDRFGNTENHILVDNEWVEKDWIGIENFNSGKLWTDGENLYYTDAYNHYVFNKDKN